MSLHCRPQVVLPIALLAMSAIIAAAFSIDCVRVADQAGERAQVADRELKDLEQRTIDLLKKDTDLPPGLRERLNENRQYYDGDDPDQDIAARHAWFESLAGRMFPVEVDPTGTASGPARHRNDQIAGLVNRWRIARAAYIEERAQYDRLLHSFRGQTALQFGHMPLRVAIPAAGNQ